MVADIILDKRSDELNEKIQQLMEKPAYEIEIKETGDISTTYKITNPLNDLPDITFEKKKFVLVSSSMKVNPVLVDKSFLDALNIRESQLRGPSVKKLFY